MSDSRPDLIAARRRVQRFVIALSSLAFAAIAVKTIDYVVSQSERNHQQECLENLRSICFAERMVQAKGEPFIGRVADLPQPIPRGNRFAYFLGSGPLEVRGPDAGAADPAATAVSVDVTGWQVPKGMKQLVLASDLPPLFLGDAGLGASGACPGPTCQFVAACAGNLDVDDELDVWSASTQPRVDRLGGRVGPCEPFHERSDLDH
jgi:type IV pilus assembly protein PilA